jgi:hypothetical protein
VISRELANNPTIIALDMSTINQNACREGFVEGVAAAHMSVHAILLRYLFTS